MKSQQEHATRLKEIAVELRQIQGDFYGYEKLDIIDHAQQSLDTAANIIQSDINQTIDGIIEELSR